MGVIVIVKVRCYFSLLETDRYVNSKSERSHNYCRLLLLTQASGSTRPSKGLHGTPVPI